MHETVREFAVVRVEDGWCVLSRERRSRRFDYRIDAEEAALKLCHEAEGRGASVKLLVQDGGGQLRPVPLS